MTSSFDRRPCADKPAIRVDGFVSDAVLRELRSRCEKAGIPQDLKRIEHFVPAPKRRRLKSRRARKRQNGAF